MGKRKRGGVSAQRQQQADTEFDMSNNKLAINSYEDVPDSEDEFHINRDKILLDGPEAKRQRQLERQDIIEASDEEVLAYDGADASSDDDAEDAYDEGSDDLESDASQAAADEENEDSDPDNWGTSKADYYGGDINETEEDALREEEAAREAQQRRLKGLKEADFGFDEDEWRMDGKGDEEIQDEGGVVTEVLPELQITDDMGEEERMDILRTRYPELEPLANELAELQVVHKELASAAQDARAQKKKTKAASIQTAQWRALSAYLGCIAMYFALLTSTASKDGGSKGLPLAPHLLHNHEIMDMLVRCREMWARVKDLEIPSDHQDSLISNGQADVMSDLESETEKAKTNGTGPVTAVSKKQRTKPTIDAAATAAQTRRAARLRSTEDSLAQLNEQLTTSGNPRRAVQSTSKTKHMNAADGDDVASDIGDEDPLPEDLAAEKARKKKSLRFYTSQIQQKANKRESARAARAGGDEDVPRRERLRDRQERLNREAEIRGKKKRDEGADLDGDDGDDEEAVTNREREVRAREVFGDPDDAEYQAMITSAEAKKDQKARREQAYADAKASGARVVPHQTSGAGGRREIGYAIEKNKGLAPRRKKEVRNPRVKKRLRFEDKKKKLGSMKAVYKGGEGKGGYGGELTGIKTGLVRSRKL